MKKVFLIFMVLGFLCFEPAQAAEWVNISQSLSEPDIRVLAGDPKNSKTIFAASRRRVYKTADGGVSWKRLLSVRGADNQVQFILADPLDSRVIYAATRRGVHRSLDGGRRWKIFFGGVGEKAKNVFCIAINPLDSQKVWLGTAQGLFWINTKTGDAGRAALGNAEIHSILFVAGDPGFALASAGDGIYRSLDEGQSWRQVFASGKHGEEETLLALENWDVPEDLPSDFISNLAFTQNRVYVSMENGILESEDQGRSWKFLEGQNFPDQKIRSMACSLNIVYAATDGGIFEWNAGLHSFHEIYKGLDSKEVHTLSYSAGGGFLLVATAKGVFRWLPVEPGPSLRDGAAQSLPNALEVLDRFRNEPSILEIQNAAVNYAEVHPGKIEAWRKAAAKKAWLPALSLDAGFDRSQNVDLDRGGTDDPDTFIIGPEDRGFDWSVGLSWDLGDLVFSSDQTSIDTRSRLMVELRDDVLTQVNHLYFERRRLQAEMTMMPQRDLLAQTEKEIRLQELTAGIDALTGGYLSKSLRQSKGEAAKRL